MRYRPPGGRLDPRGRRSPGCGSAGTPDAYTRGVPAPPDSPRFRGGPASRRLSTLRRSLRASPVLGPLVAGAAYLPSRVVSMEWYRVMERAPGDADPAVDGLEVRRADRGDGPLFESIGKNTADEFERRLSDGDVAFVATLDGNPAGHLWFRSGAWDEGDVRYVLDEDDRWGYDLFVHPGACGRGVGPALNVAGLRQMAAREGATRMLSVVDVLNDASLASAARSGGVPRAELVVLSVGPLGAMREKDFGTGATRWRRLRRGGPTDYRVSRSRVGAAD